MSKNTDSFKDLQFKLAGIPLRCTLNVASFSQLLLLFMHWLRKQQQWFYIDF